TAVYPPSAAHRLPDSIVSASSLPGWRRWVCRSTSPGLTMQPAASSTVAPSTVSPSVTAAIRPSESTCTSARRLPVASTTVPPATRSPPRAPAAGVGSAMDGNLSLVREHGVGAAGAEEEEEDGHADRHPVGDLLADDGP